MSNLVKYYDKLKYELDLPVEFLVDDTGLVELFMSKYNSLQFYCRKLEQEKEGLEAEVDELRDELDRLRDTLEINKY
jgi:cell shape-determining protein MreC